MSRPVENGPPSRRLKTDPSSERPPAVAGGRRARLRGLQRRARRGGGGFGGADRGGWRRFGRFGLGRRAERRSAGPRADAATGCLSVFGLSGGWAAAEVAVAEPVAVALQAEDLGVVDEPVDHCGG